jgi:organic hydroperoxide reductase OsmC/OhrA
MTIQLARAVTTSRLTGVGGRAVVSMRGHHMVVDSPLPLGGPNEEINPIELLLASLATCATFVCETAAREADIPLTEVTAHVEGEFDVRGVCGEPVDPHIQAFHVALTAAGTRRHPGKNAGHGVSDALPDIHDAFPGRPIDVQVHLGATGSS